MIRCAERNLHYARAWRDLETGFGSTPDELTHRQIVALAGEFYSTSLTSVIFPFRAHFQPRA